MFLFDLIKRETINARYVFVIHSVLKWDFFPPPVWGVLGSRDISLSHVSLPQACEGLY